MRGAAAAFSRAFRGLRQVLSPRGWALCGALIAGLTAYVLVLSAPVVSQRAREVVASGPVAGATAWELGVAAGGMALLGGAALMFVLAWLAREAESRPYASIAPVLAAFSACVLMGLRAPLPLPGIASEPLAVFALAATVLGGSLVRERALSTQLAGLALALFPAFSVLGVIWVATGHADPARAYLGLAPRALAFVGMLLLSSFAVALIATLGRDAEDAARAREARALGASPPPLTAERTHEGARRREGLRWEPTWRAAFLGVAVLVMAGGAAVVMLRAGSATPTVVPLRPAPAASTIRGQAQQGPSVRAGAVTLGSGAQEAGGAQEPSGVLEPVVEPAASAPDAGQEWAPVAAPAAQPDGEKLASQEPARSRRGAVASKVKSKTRSKAKARSRRQHRRHARPHARRARDAAPPSWGAVLGELPKPPASSRAQPPKPVTLGEPPKPPASSRAQPPKPVTLGEPPKPPASSRAQPTQPAALGEPPKPRASSRAQPPQPAVPGAPLKPFAASRKQPAQPAALRAPPKPLPRDAGARKAPPARSTEQDASTVRDVPEKARPRGDESLDDLMQRALSP